MRRILYLYPRRWRDRYGDEMDQLLDDAPLTARGVASIGMHALQLRMRDGGTQAGLCAVLALVALLPLMIMAYLWLNFAVLHNPIDAPVLWAVLDRVQPFQVMPVLGLVLAAAPMLQQVTHADGRSTLRLRWRRFPVHAALTIVGAAGTAIMLVEVYDTAWHAVAQWYWATCDTSCGEPWMAPVSLAGTLYPWILLAPAGWLAWRRRLLRRFVR
jgi:hypothetical protein